MPRPLLFVPCEKAIISQDHTISIISVLEKIVSSVPVNIELPEHAAVPTQWSVITVWSREDSDKEKRFETITQLVAQDGSLAMHLGPVEIKTTPEQPRYRHIGTVEQLPITDGNLTVKLLMREIGSEEWLTVGDYPIEIGLSRP